MKTIIAVSYLTGWIVVFIFFLLVKLEGSFSFPVLFGFGLLVVFETVENVRQVLHMCITTTIA